METQFKYFFLLCVQMVILALIMIGHGRHSWEDREQMVIGNETYGGIWQYCIFPQPGCKILEENKHMPNMSSEWVEVNFARTFLLLSNLVGFVEIALLVLSGLEIIKEIGCCSLFALHSSMLITQGILAFLAASLMTDAFHVTDNNQRFNIGWSLIFLWLGASSLGPILVATVGKLLWMYCPGNQCPDDDQEEFIKSAKVGIDETDDKPSGSEKKTTRGSPSLYSLATTTPAEPANWRINNTYEMRSDYNVLMNEARKEYTRPPPRRDTEGPVAAPQKPTRPNKTVVA